MDRRTEIVQRIPSHYVGEDCIQIGLGYQDTMTILDEEGVVFHTKTKSSESVNRYLIDERRTRFPYSNIPSHRSKYKGEILTFVNQLLDFKKPYIIIRDGLLSECFAVKDGQQALLLSGFMQYDKRTTYHMTYNELLAFLSSFQEEKGSATKTYFAFKDGSRCCSDFNSMGFPTKDEIENRLFNHIQEFMKEAQEDLKKTIFWVEWPTVLKYIEASIENLDLSLIDFNIDLFGKLRSLIIVKLHEGDITIQEIRLTFVRKDDYKVDVCDWPVNKYTLEQLKSSPKICVIKEPAIPLKLNPEITRQDICEAESMIKAFKNSAK